MREVRLGQSATEETNLVLTFIIPAYNEESSLPHAMGSIREAVAPLGRAHEIIVVDDASEDRTAEVAVEEGARVVPIHRRQIAAARNAGARAAKGEILVFLDADTTLPAATLEAALRALEKGAVGGGADVRFDRSPRFSARLASRTLLLAMRLVHCAAGCFIFARREAFERIGGFDERYFVSEEIHLSRALGRLGSFVILREHVVTSARKLRILGLWQIVSLCGRLLLGGQRAVQRREGLEVWYDGSLREG